MSSLPLRITDPADLDDELTAAQMHQRAMQQEFRAVKRWFKLMSNNFGEAAGPSRRHIKRKQVRSASARKRMMKAQARNLDAQQWLRTIRAERQTFHVE